jgi:hypothetical protein
MWRNLVNRSGKPWANDWPQDRPIRHGEANWIPMSTGFLARTSVFAIGFLVTGCQSIRGFPEPPATMPSGVVAPALGYQLSPSAIVAYNNETDPAKKKILRNEIIDARMAELDRKFADFERALYRDGIGVGVGTDWAFLALTAASTISTVTSTKTTLSAIATATAGGASAFDKRILFDKTLPALLAQMVAGRESARSTIRANEQLAVVDYSWSAAESALGEFEFAGSIPGAIAGVAQDAGKKTADAKQELKELTKAKFVKSSTSTLLHNFWKPDGTVNAANESSLKNWLTTNGFASDPGSITMFLYDASKEESRAAAAKDLHLQ